MHASTYEYLKPTDEQTDKMARVRAAAKAFSDVLEAAISSGVRRRSDRLRRAIWAYLLTGLIFSAKRCETCKHWKPNDEWDVEAGGLRACDRVVPKWIVEDRVPEELRDARYGGADDAEDAAYKAAADKVFSEAGAVVNDGSQFRAELLTRPDFGCTLHEAV